MIVVLVSVFALLPLPSACSNDLDELVIKESFDFSIAFWAFSAAADVVGAALNPVSLLILVCSISSALNSDPFSSLLLARDRYGLGVLVIFQPVPPCASL